MAVLVEIIYIYTRSEHSKKERKLNVSKLKNA